LAATGHANAEDRIMAEQRPYRLPGSSADERLRRVKQRVLLWLGMAFVAINQTTTQHAAFVLHYAPWLGHPLIHLFGVALYPPWAWIVWFAEWHWAPELEPLWRECVLQVFLPMGFMSTLMCIALAMIRRDWFSVSDLHGSARWATTRDLNGVRLLETRRSFAHRAGVYLGVWRRGYLRDCGPAHVLVFAPTRSGKGVGVVIPTLLSWPHSVLVHDLKGENWALTAGARQRMGQCCLRFAPASAESDGARYNPLAEVRLRTPNEIRDVRNIVQMIIDPDGRGLPDHWSREGSAFLTGMILHQLYNGRDQTLSGLETRLCDPSQPIDDTLAQIMRAEHDPGGAMGWTDGRGIATRTHPIIARAMRSMLDKSPNERSGVISEVKGFLELYRDPVIAANTATSDFRIVDLMNHERPVSLYIVVPLAHKNSLKPVIRLLLSQIVHRLTEQLEYRNGRAVTGYRYRLLLMIDEFPSLGRLDVFAESLALVAGYGIKACLIAQDLSQIHAAYGHDEAITSNCHTRVAFTPNRIETARLLSQMTGETTVRHAHRTVSSSGASVSEPEVARPLITPDEVMRLGGNEALIFTSGRPAIRARKLRYYNEPAFQRLAAIPPPTASDRIERGDERAEVLSKLREADQADDPGDDVVHEAPTVVAANGANPRRTKATSDPRQLSFLQAALDDDEDAAALPEQRERLL
jgi:type IV secretion system protein VirD4